MAIGCVNVHLRKEEMRNVLYGIVQDQNLDICAVSETWLAVDTSEKLMGKVFGSDFVWFDRERKHQKGTFGGVGLLCRKSAGVFSLIKVSNQYEILWVKLCRNNDLYFFCSVYIPPTKSRREDAKEVLIETVNFPVKITHFWKHGLKSIRKFV